MFINQPLIQFGRVELGPLANFPQQMKLPRRSNLETMTRRTSGRAGISGVTPFALRNTYTAKMLRLGVNPAIISDLLGDRASELLRYYSPLKGKT
jgi:integrase